MFCNCKKRLDKRGGGAEEEQRQPGRAMQELFQRAGEKKVKTVKKRLTKKPGVGRSEHAASCERADGVCERTSGGKLRAARRTQCAAKKKVKNEEKSLTKNGGRIKRPHSQ